MTQAGYAALVSAKPIRALIIQPDNSYEVREIEQDLQAWQDLVGGYVQSLSTPYCLIFCSEEADQQAAPCNAMATYLWWKLSPEMEGVDQICGPVFITGLPSGEDPTPVTDEVIELFERMEKVRQEEESK